MPRLDEGDIHVLDTAGRNVDRAVAGIEDRLRRLEAALAAGLTGVNRGIAELWRELYANAKPEPDVVVEETTEIDEGKTETANPEAVAGVETEDKHPRATSKHTWLGKPPARTAGTKKRWI